MSTIIPNFSELPEHTRNLISKVSEAGLIDSLVASSNIMAALSWYLEQEYQDLNGSLRAHNLSKELDSGYSKSALENAVHLIEWACHETGAADLQDLVEEYGKLLGES